MIERLLTHYKQLLTCRHDGSGFPWIFSDWQLGYIAIYALLFAFEMLNNISNSVSLSFSIIMSILIIVLSPQAFAGLVLIKVFELTAISLCDFVAGLCGYYHFSHLNTAISIYATICVFALFYRSLRKDRL